MALRFQNNYDFQDIPIPTNTARQAPRTGATVRRAKTLTKPERSVAPVPLITPAKAATQSQSTLPQPEAKPQYPGSPAWRIFSRIITFWAPDFVLKSVGGLKDDNVRQAWREKITLCFIILILCGAIGFATVGFQRVLCPNQGESDSTFVRVGSDPNTLAVHGVIYNVSQATNSGTVNFRTLASQFGGQDITHLFQRTAATFPSCAGIDFRIARDEPCPDAQACPLPALVADETYRTLRLIKTPLAAGYSWEQVAALQNFAVLDGAVLNLTPYITLHSRPVPSDNVDKAIRTLLASPDSGKDGTKLFFSREDLKSAVPCLKQRYLAGNIDKVTPGCFVSSLVLYAGLIVILGLVVVRFIMACIFNWFMSSRLAGAVTSKDLNRSAISPAVLPEGAMVSIDNRTGTAPWANSKKLTKGGAARPPRSIASASSATLVNNDSLSPIMSLTQIGAELFAVCLVTCYSEGEESLRTTLDSISSTDYSDQRKLLFIVADGMITGAGEKRSTPDICVSLLEADPRFGNPIPMSYTAVGSGSKANNRAMVYAGHYTVAGRRTPTIIVVKCGTEQEALHEKKPGNRGKRDSQLILMNFFSRVTYNDRMSPLDFDMFRKVHVLMGVTPDFFEVCLMVDADTKVFPGSLGSLVNCMHHDQMIMGVCGETRIANKRQSWVTAIQVFEYFISHHLAKAFESVFGGVTCLPGCFSMFRLKARKASGDDWVPLIIKPEIVKEYSQSDVVTLHQKNLLLLGEDRFLTTILLRTFPNRKMMFLPQAKCRTVVPDTFAILLSQRRRWINSTIHNLLELVLVRNLCGTFCFSMQFVVFMDLLGTVVLPIAISLTYALVVASAINPPKNFEQAIPIMLLISVLGLPAILILLTTRKLVYVFWMMIYLIALPIWNFVLPLYSFWHFDDFSWGETRKVEGEGKDKGHGEGTGSAVSVPLRRWEDWERSRLRKLKREERRRKDLERSYPGGAFGGNHLAAPDTRSQYGDSSDTYSITSSDDDHWGSQIGGYNENNVQYPPPPVALFTPQREELESAQTLGGAELEAMLEAGFDEPKARPASYMTRYQLSDSTSSPPPVQNAGQGHGYAPLNRAGSPGITGPSNTALSPTSPSLHLSGEGHDSPNWRTPQGRGPPQRYGPLGPLDPSAKF